MTDRMVGTRSDMLFRGLEILDTSSGFGVWGLQSKRPLNPLGEPVPWLQQVLYRVDTLHLEMFDVYKPVKGFEIYHWSLPSVLFGN